MRTGMLSDRGDRWPLLPFSSCDLSGMRLTDAKHPRSLGRRPQWATPRTQYTALVGARRARRGAPAADRGSRGHLHGTIDTADGAPAVRPRRRWQRLVLPGARRGVALAAIESSHCWREDLGGG